MRLTIIPSDNAVYKDGVMKAWTAPELDLSGCGIPAHVHALQWYDTYGEIEFDSPTPTDPKPPNEILSELPEWALLCVAVWNAWNPPEPEPVAPQAQPTQTGAEQF